METKEVTVVTTETVAQTEKKINMSLDEIIEMSKENTLKGKRAMRRPLKKQGNQNGNVSQRSARAQLFVDSRSSIRQSDLAYRRSKYNGNQFPLVKEVGKKATAMAFTNRFANGNRTRLAASISQGKFSNGHFAGKNQVVSSQRPRTLDARFANIWEQKMRLVSQQGMAVNGRPGPRISQRQQWSQGEELGYARRRLGLATTSSFY